MQRLSSKMIKCVRFSFLFAIISLCAVFSLPHKSLSCAEQFSISSFNLKNYLICDRVVDGKFLKNYPKPDEEKQAVYNAIKSINPTILCIQEIGSEAFLNELIAALKQHGCSMPYSAILDAKDSKRMIAILSKVPFAEIFLEKSISFDYFGRKEFVRRGLLGVKIEVNKADLYLYVVHLKSKLDSPNDKLSKILRKSEAAAVMKFIKSRHGDFNKTPIAIAGDFNDTKSSKTLKIFVENGMTIPACEDGRKESWTYYYDRDESYYRNDFILLNDAAKKVFAEPTRVVDTSDWSKASDHRLIYSSAIATSL